MPDNDAVVGALERIGKILTGILLKAIDDFDQDTKIARLKQSGFENKEIAAMLGTTPNTVNVQWHKFKKAVKKRPKKKAARAGE